MHAVASLLDAQHTEQVERLREALAADCALAGRFPAVPHVSYHVATGYPGELTASIARLAAGTAPFRLRATGVAVFPGPAPVIYVPVVRAPALEAVHRAVWSAVGAVPGTTGHYVPERWLPHITVAQGTMDRRQLSAAIALTSARDIDWDIAIDNFVLVQESAADEGIVWRHVLGRDGAGTLDAP